MGISSVFNPFKRRRDSSRDFSPEFKFSSALQGNDRLLDSEIEETGKSPKSMGSGDRYYEMFIAPIQRENRAWLVATALLAVAIAEAMALWQLIPLKERVPYVLEFDANTGRIEVAQRVLTKLNVSAVSVDYFLRKWITRVDSLDSQTIGESIPRAAAWTRADAVKELDEYIQKQKLAERLVRFPERTQVVEVKTISYINDGKIALVRYDVVERSSGAETKRIPRLLTATVSLISPDAGSELERDNPIGLTISHFQISDEVNK